MDQHLIEGIIQNTTNQSITIKFKYRNTLETPITKQIKTLSLTLGDKVYIVFDYTRNCVKKIHTTIPQEDIYDIPEVLIDEEEIATNLELSSI